MPYGFIILSWTNQPQWCKSQRHLIKILKSSVSINFYTKRRHYCIKKKFYTKRRHYCIKKKLLMENLAKNWKILLRVTQCFLPCQFLNKHGFPLGKIFIKFNIVSSLSPRKMGKLKLCLRRWLYQILQNIRKGEKRSVFLKYLTIDSFLKNDIIFVSINASSSHWVLLVLYLKEWKGVYLDSLLSFTNIHETLKPIF